MVSRAIMGVTSSSHLQATVTRLLLMDSSLVMSSRAMHSKVTTDIVMHSLLSSRVISRATVSRDFLMDNLKQAMLLRSQLMELLQQLRVGTIIMQQLLLLLLQPQLQQQHLQLKVETSLFSHVLAWISPSPRVSSVVMMQDLWSFLCSSYFA